MTTTGEAPRQRRPRQHRPRRCRPLAWRAAGWLAAFLVLLPVVVSLGAYVRYRSVWDSIRRIDVTGLGHRPPKYNNALNVLLIGSDSRAGQNRRFGAGIQGQRSDTIMLLHISPDHHHMTVVSIPRDTVRPASTSTTSSSSRLAHRAWLGPAADPAGPVPDGVHGAERRPRRHPGQPGQALRGPHRRGPGHDDRRRADSGHDADHRREPAQPVVEIGAVRFGPRGSVSARSASRDQVRATAGQRAVHGDRPRSCAA